MGTAWLAGSAPATAMLWKQSQNVPRLQESFSSGEVRFVLLQRRGGSGKLHLQRGRDAVPEQDARAENLYSPLCWSSLATRLVQPVWWLAPRPAPLSPWKYS